jgi:hypothetical protein
LLERALGHASATIRQLAQSILDEAMRHPDRLDKLPTAMWERIRCLCNRSDDHDPGGPGSSIASETTGHIPKLAPASAATVRTVEKEVLKEVHTYRPRPEVQVSWPDVPRRFQQLPQDQQRNLMARLRGLSLEQRRAVLAEWDARCESGGVHNVIAYLYGLIKKAVDGMFKLWEARKPVPQQTPQAAVSSSPPDAPSAVLSPSPSSQAAKPASREVAQRHLEQIRRMLKLPPQPIGQIIENLACSGRLAQPGDLAAAGGLGPAGTT